MRTFVLGLYFHLQERYCGYWEWALRKCERKTVLKRRHEIGLPINEGLFRTKPVLRESGKETLDALGLEGGW